jgi:cytochrome c oxidase subunit 3
VTTAAPTISARIHSLNRPNLVSIGTIVWLSSELMFFAGLFAIYFTARAQNPPGNTWPPAPTELNVPYALVVTIVLVASSFTCQFGVFAAERGDVFGLRRWYLLTLAMGTFFVLGQANEYHSLVGDGVKLNGDGYGSMFYLTTGFHGLHVTGGLIAFLFVLGRTFVAKRFTHEQAVSAIVVSYYWHFVDVVWIGLFATIYIIQ